MVAIGGFSMSMVAIGGSSMVAIGGSSMAAIGGSSMVAIGGSFTDRHNYELFVCSSLPFLATWLIIAN